MKSVLFVSRLAWPHVGGVEKHIDKLIPEFSRRNVQLTIVTSQHDPTLPVTETRQGAQIFRLPNTDRGHKLSTWKAILSRWRLFLQSDVIHIHDVFWWILPLYPFIFHKLFITFHGYEGNDAPTHNQIFWHRLAARLTRGNICIGDFHQTWYQVTPTVVSYGAVDNSLLSLKHQKKNPFSLVFIGRLSVDNGILEYLKAFQLLHQQNAKYTLAVYGDGPQKTASTAFVKQARLPVTFHGFVPNADQHLKTGGVACLSRYLAILEAIAVNTPVVAHFNNRIKHDYLALAPFAKWIAIADTPTDLAQAIIKPRTYPVAARTWIRQQTWRTMAKNYLSLWNA